MVVFVTQEAVSRKAMHKDLFPLEKHCIEFPTLASQMWEKRVKVCGELEQKQDKRTVDFQAQFLMGLNPT